MPYTKTKYVMPTTMSLNKEQSGKSSWIKSPGITGGSKYRSKKVEIDGQRFDSLKEARRWKELKYLQNARQISDLQRQVKFVLIPTQKDKDKHTLERECSYFADFVYKDADGRTVVEDVKGYTAGNAYSLFTIKRKLMLYIHHIEVKEV